jgi:hypothetical protein
MSMWSYLITDQTFFKCFPLGRFTYLRSPIEQIKCMQQHRIEEPRIAHLVFLIVSSQETLLRKTICLQDLRVVNTET